MIKASIRRQVASHDMAASAWSASFSQAPPGACAGTASIASAKAAGLTAEEVAITAYLSRQLGGAISDPKGKPLKT